MFCKKMNVIYERRLVMRKKTKLILIVCAMLCSLIVYTAQAQMAPTGAARGGAMQGGRGGMMGGMGFGRGPAAPVGPPSPVPQEVAIPRPTSEEVDKINIELKRFIDTNNSAVKDLLKKYASLLTVQVPRANSAVAPTQTFVRTTERHDGFVEIAKKGDFDILFHGDSITDWWQQSGVEAQKKYFSDIKIANFAIAGDTTQGLLWGLQNGEGQGKPKAIMLMIGTNNNTSGNTAEEIAEGVGAVVLELRKDFPDAKIMLLAIFPRGNGPTDSSRMKNDVANKIIAKLDDGKHVFFKNINDKFLDAQGRLIGFQQDMVHPGAQGYDIWGAAVADTLKSWLK
jgi:lysophospholipase L1-like esterase